MSPNERELKHSDLLYDYIKFHLNLYIATPTVLAIIAAALGIAAHPDFQRGLACLIVVYFVAGIHASWTIASHINVDWNDDQKWASFGNKASSGWRRFVHHYLYWAGLAVAMGGMVSAWS
jgi:type III secretory pathway component EscR